jgi:hypothetical protein
VYRWVRPCTQIRRAVYGGPYIDLLESLAQEEKLLLIRKSAKTATDKSDQELILRLLALALATCSQVGWLFTSWQGCSCQRWALHRTTLSNTVYVASFWGLTVWLPQTSATQTPQQNAG